jgi:hypothetical protein
MTAAALLDLPTLANGGLLIPLLIVAGLWVHWRLTTTTDSDEGDLS